MSAAMALSVPSHILVSMFRQLLRLLCTALPETIALVLEAAKILAPFARDCLTEDDATRVGDENTLHPGKGPKKAALSGLNTIAFTRQRSRWTISISVSLNGATNSRFAMTQDLDCGLSSSQDDNPRLRSIRDSAHQLKPPSSSRQLSSTSSASTSNFAKSVGPGRYHTERPHASRPNGRSGHARSKSQAPRPRTAHGIRDEDRFPRGIREEEAPGNNGTTVISQVKKGRDSSLTEKFNNLSLYDEKSSIGIQAISRPSTRNCSQSSTISYFSNVTYSRPGSVARFCPGTSSRGGPAMYGGRDNPTPASTAPKTSAPEGVET
ncbi:Fc.00g075000.m01.CDS01 [Cosmosporella sp. VM-42]